MPSGQKKPASHVASCAMEPAGQCAPARHATCVAGVAQNEPAAHADWFTLRGGQYVVAAHGVRVAGVVQ